MFSQDEIAVMACASFLAANNTYIRISGGFHMHNSGIESFAAAAISQDYYRLAREKYGTHSYSLLEVPIKNLVNWSNSTVSAKEIEYCPRASGRADIVFYDENDRLMGIMEIKRHFGLGRMKEDIQRSEWLLENCSHRRGGTLEWVAFLGFTTTKQTSENETLKKQISEFETYFYKHNYSLRKKHDEKKFEDKLDNGTEVSECFHAACIVVSKK